MPLRPTDFTLTEQQRERARAALHDWDARDPWAKEQRRAEAAIMQGLEVACAPRIVLLPSPAHAARFLRSMVEGGRGAGS